MRDFIRYIWQHSGTHNNFFNLFFYVCTVINFCKVPINYKKNSIFVNKYFFLEFLLMFKMRTATDRNDQYRLRQVSQTTMFSSGNKWFSTLLKDVTFFLIARSLLKSSFCVERLPVNKHFLMFLYNISYVVIWNTFKCIK